MRRLLATLLLCPVLLGAQAPASFTLEHVKGYPFPSALTSQGNRLAWTLDERGKRNVFVSEAPGGAVRQLSRYEQADGQEISSVAISRDGQWVTWVRGGDHSANWDDALPVNATHMPLPPKVQIWAARFDGSGSPKAIADGDEPVISPRSDVVLFVRDRAIWSVPLDGSTQPKRIVVPRGEPSDIRFSPDGSRIAFVAGRGDHAFIGVFADDSVPITWLAPSTSRDASPRWSTDGTQIAFVRRAGSGGAPDSILVPRHQPWAIMIGDANTGAAREIWRAPRTLRGSPPSTHGGTNLHWAEGRIVFASYQDGWPHLYSISPDGGQATLLTPGRYMVEHVTMSPDRRSMLFTANSGPELEDIDRRHVVRVAVEGGGVEQLTEGDGLEWSPVMLEDGSVGMITATAQRPPLVALLDPGTREQRLLGAERIPADFPTAQLVTPRQVIFRAPDSTAVHAQLFWRPGGEEKRPAVIFVHGGPPRQMLLGWNYSDYYSNSYATNQYLASKGFAVLSVNYRLGIGYGYEFHQPANGGARGAVEYQDLKAAAEWLATQPGIDAKRIGIYGGSYGGFLTALALARDSRLFAAGVDIHGVHDWTTERARGMLNRDRFEEAPDVQRALNVAWRSSPVSAVGTWKSPVLLIHADDDRNVRFSQTVDLARRLEKQGVPFEELIIPDDTHHMMYANWVRVGEAVADFFVRKLKP
jgi:dipeptidyl aminopeptidase/acylaminoacyl peptidase